MLRAVNAYGLYLTSIGDNDTEIDPIQWNVNAFNKWRRNNCALLLAKEVVFEITPFGMSFSSYRSKLTPSIKLVEVEYNKTQVLQVVYNSLNHNNNNLIPLMIQVVWNDFDIIVQNWEDDEENDVIIMCTRHDNNNSSIITITTDSTDINDNNHIQCHKK